MGLKMREVYSAKDLIIRTFDFIKNKIAGSRFRSDVFSNIYRENLWGDTSSRSGCGSNLENTAIVRKEMPEIFKKYNIQSVLDAPCGDFFWFKEISHLINSYIGVDIVEELIISNENKYASGSIKFFKKDIVVDSLPSSDCVVCRDCLIHLNKNSIIKVLLNFRKSGAKYLLLTNCSNVHQFRDIITGSFRPINFLLKPFNFPKPLEIIKENNEGRELCLWKISDIDLNI